jgi:hypothetical protein
VYPTLARLLDQRFIAAVADMQTSGWKINAKLDHGLRGEIGTLMVSDDAIAFEARKPNVSRSWRISDIDNVTTTGVFDLVVTTNEKAGAFRGGMRQFHFQLQKAMTNEQYESLWQAVNRSKGLVFLESQRGVRQ